MSCALYCSNSSYSLNTCLSLTIGSVKRGCWANKGYNTYFRSQECMPCMGGVAEYASSHYIYNQFNNLSTKDLEKLTSQKDKKKKIKKKSTSDCPYSKDNQWCLTFRIINIGISHFHKRNICIFTIKHDKQWSRFPNDKHFCLLLSLSHDQHWCLTISHDKQ
jgi:hypothetical protein